MITVKHPLEECNRQQEEFLSKVSQEERRFHELFFAVGNASYLYYQRATDFDPSFTDFEEWLEGLSENVRLDMSKKGFEECKTVLSFRRYVNEKNDIGMEEYIENLMGEEYQEYKEKYLKQG
ncbi:hypothetical protein [Desertivirga arenae]|uniref:hypothetical protein n=1 Tax=Desertivirga arenae TaxID=2810309 RepID=UPI001A9785D1|nr:hypothetical protein [Pedobacter sp. SYSU D00823]